MIEDKSGFLNYINKLSVMDSTKGTYRNWVSRIDTNLPKKLSAHTVRNEQDISNLAKMMPADKFTPGHFKDVKCIIRYYLKYLLSKEVETQQDAAEAEGEFTPGNEKTARQKVLRNIAIRRGQRKFRKSLIRAYNGECPITNTTLTDALEAAHIRPYCADGLNTTGNGILLRSDVHVLFDLNLISIDPSCSRVYCSESIRKDNDYGKLHRKKVQLPNSIKDRPDRKLLMEHYQFTKSIQPDSEKQ